MCGREQRLSAVLIDFVGPTRRDVVLDDLGDVGVEVDLPFSLRAVFQFRASVRLVVEFDVLGIRVKIVDVE